MTANHSSPERHRVAAALTLVALCLLHLGRLTAFFGGWGDLLSNVPLIHEDHGWHYYYCVLGSRFLVETGTFSAYDPFLMAGYPTDLLDTSDRLLKLLMALLPVSAPLGYKLAVFLSGAAFPLVWYFAARLLDFSRLESMFATGGGLWVWWSGIGLSFFDVGMTGFLLAAAFGFLVGGLFFQYLNRPGVGRGAALAAGLGVGLLIHPGVLPIIALPAAALLFLRRRQVKLRTILGLLLSGAAALAMNYFWIIPQFINLRYAAGSANLLQFSLGFLSPLFDQAFRHARLAPIFIPVAAGLGFRQWGRAGARERYLTLGLTLAGLAGAFLLGGYLPLVRNTQPVRYVVPLFFAACLPAGSWLARQAIEAWSGRGRRPALVVVAAAALAAPTFFLPPRGPGARPFVGVGPDVALARDWILRSTDREARVMVEDRGPITGVFDSTFPMAYLALSTGRELIGGPHWATFLLQHYADLSGNLLFGRPLSAWGGPGLAQEMRRFNVGWLVVRNPLLIARLDRFPDLFAPLGEEGGFRFYRCLAARGFFVEGSGRVRASYNLLRVEGATPERGRVVLSYHWHPCLTVDPPRRLIRVPAGDDPVGFVAVEGEGGDYDIRFRYPLLQRADD